MIPNAGYNPYYLSDFNNYNAQAYDNSGYGNYNNFNNISPFSAWVRNNITGLGAPPPGMTAGAYGERMQTLSDRFSKYGAYSAAFTGASYLGSMAFMFPDVTHAAATGISAAIGGAPLGHGGLLNRALGGVLSANPIGILNSAFNLPINAASQAFLQPNATKLGAGLMRGLDTFGGMGSSLSENLDSIIGGINEKGWLGGIKTGINAAGSKSAFLARAFELPFKLATGFAAYAAVAGVTDTVLQGALNAAVGVDIEQDKISDTFESLSSRVLYGGSGHNAKSFAKEMAKEIRQRSFADATPTGLMGYLGISDTAMGRFTGGWSAISEMQTKTAQYGLMAESGLLSKSGSADEFIKKADAMYAAIAKLGDALGQTTTKAMETARVLKSQGISDPLGIANAGGMISTSAAMSGYSHNQVMAIASEATEAFRGSLFSSDAAYGLANSVIRKTALAPNLIGSQAYDKLLYENRGQDSMNVNLTRTMAGVSNSHEMRQMLIASMYKRTKTGFEFTGNVNASEINNAVSGNSFLNDENTLALLNSNFQGLTQSEMRAAERSLSKFSSNLTGADMQNAFGAFAKRRGYGNQQDMFETIFRQQGMSPDAAFNMAKLITADTRAQELTYDYFNRRETQLSKYVSDRIDAESETGLSKLTFGYHKMFGRRTALVETAALAGLGGLIGGPIGAVIGAGIGIASGSTYYQGVGERMGYSGARATAAGAAGDIAANLGIYGVARYGYGLAGGGLAGLGAVGIGAGAGYAADWVTANYLSDWSSGKQMGASGGMGLGIGAGAAALLGFGPVGWAAAGLVGLGTGAYLAYDRLFRNENIGEGERENLRNQMQVLQSGDKLKLINPAVYNRLVSESTQSEIELKFTNYGTSAKKMTTDIKRNLYEKAGEITRAFYLKTPNASNVRDVENLLNDYARTDITNYDLYEKGEKGTLDDNYVFRGYAQEKKGSEYNRGLDFKAVEDVPSALGFLQLKYGGKAVKIGSPDEFELSKLRYMTSMLPEHVRLNIEKKIFNSLSGTKFVDANNQEVYDVRGFFKGHEQTPFQRSKEFLNKSIDRINARFAKELGSKDSVTMVSSHNIAGIYTLLDAYGTDRYADAVENAGKMMSSDELLLFDQMTKDGRLSKDAVKALKKDLADSYLVAQDSVYQESIGRFSKAKSAMLGDDFSAVKGHMSRLLGRGDMSSEDLVRYNALKSNNFKSVSDTATREFLQQSEGAMGVLGQVHGKTWEEYQQIVEKADLDSSTKQMLLDQLTGKDKRTTLLSDDVSNMTKSIGRQLVAANMPGMTQSTLQSLSEQQVSSLTSIDKKMSDLILAVKEKNGTKSPETNSATPPPVPNSPDEVLSEEQVNAVQHAAKVLASQGRK